MTQRDPIIMYSTTWCPDCRRAKQFLDRRGTAYAWIDIDKDPVAAREVMRINGGMRSVPTLVFGDGSVLVEPSNKRLGETLDALESRQGTPGEAHG